ncbi:MAG: nucleoside triphosphate pyrophosphohydrolase [Candidatus Saccharimonadales bacterium]
MKSFILNKLVRDKILDDMQNKGQQAALKELSDKEFLHELSRKLVEEANEFSSADPKEALKELADVLEVVEALAGAIGSDFESLRAIQSERKAKRGGFDKRIYVGRLDLADDDPWVDYYAEDPEKYKEVEE